MDGEEIQQVSARCCSRHFRSQLSAAPVHAAPMTSAHVCMFRAACLCFLSHRFSMLLQRWQLPNTRQRFASSRLLASRALLPAALLCLTISPPRCFPPCALAAPASIQLHHANTSASLPPALVDLLTLESEQQRPPCTPAASRINTAAQRETCAPQSCRPGVPLQA
jgi:hypothetical protein